MNLKCNFWNAPKKRSVVINQNYIYAFTLLNHLPFLTTRTHTVGATEPSRTFLKTFNCPATRGQRSVSTSWTDPIGNSSRNSVSELSRTWNVLTQNTAKCSIRGAYTRVTSRRSRTRVSVYMYAIHTTRYVLVMKPQTSFQMFWKIELDSNNVCRNSREVYMCWFKSLAFVKLCYV